eukprot:m.166772 g.166772  ORF g.166772 m.166772 type:complete len:320 (+) comp15290_c1_seq1:320-1279(+)
MENPPLDTPEGVASMCDVITRFTSLPFIINSSSMPLWPNLYANFYGTVCAFQAWNCSNRPTMPPPVEKDIMGNSSCVLRFVQAMYLVDTITPQNFMFDENEALLAAKLTVPLRLHAPFGFNTDIMDKTRAQGEGIIFPVRAYSPEFLITERTAMTPRITFQSVSSTFVAVLCASLFFLSPGEAVTVTLCVIFVILDLFGLMALWDVSLNVSSVVMLCLAVGFCADYASHIAKAISALPNNKAWPMTRRVSHALNHQGVSVLHAGISTLVAVLVLAFAHSTGFQVMFRMLFGMVVFGVAHGLCFLPAVQIVFAQMYKGKH